MGKVHPVFLENWFSVRVVVDTSHVVSLGLYTDLLFRPFSLSILTSTETRRPSRTPNLLSLLYTPTGPRRPSVLAHHHFSGMGVAEEKRQRAGDPYVPDGGFHTGPCGKDIYSGRVPKTVTTSPPYGRPLRPLRGSSGGIRGAPRGRRLPWISRRTVVAVQRRRVRLRNDHSHVLLSAFVLPLFPLLSSFGSSSAELRLYRRSCTPSSRGSFGRPKGSVGPTTGRRWVGGDRRRFGSRTRTGWRVRVGWGGMGLWCVVP